VSESLARELWPGGSALGRTVRANDGRDDFTFTIVGVAADIRNRGAFHPPEPVLYESFYQNPWLPSMDLLVRHEEAGPTFLAAVREALHAVDPTVPLSSMTSLEAVLARNTVEPRHYAILLGVFSLVALLIAAVGVYATVSYTVARRLREIGIRRAVGAPGGHVVGLVIGRAMAQASAGAALGLGLATFAVHSLEDLLFEIAPSDPATWASVTVVLLGAALAASVLPAVRATRVDPLMVLHGD
jgi:predicted lysophospholipase L1 biosynthesis ABC-type transport system permease subunit